VELCIHFPNTPSWRGAQLKKKHRSNFTFTLHLGLPNGLFPPGFVTKTVYALLGKVNNTNYSITKKILKFQLSSLARHMPDESSFLLLFLLKLTLKCLTEEEHLPRR
jgi:hypothetical protein